MKERQGKSAEKRLICWTFVALRYQQQKAKPNHKHTATMSMNLFRLAGDMSHIFSIIVLLLRLRVAKNAQGAYELYVLLVLLGTYAT